MSLMKLNLLIFDVIFFIATLSVVQCAVTCPPEASYTPCICREAASNPGLITVACPRLNLNDADAGKILDSFLNTPNVSPVGFADFSTNQITRIPDQIKLFPQFIGGNFEDNEIVTIQTGAFNFSRATLHTLVLAYDNIKSIEPGAFQGESYGQGSIISLYNNSLTRIESDVFKSVLEKMAPFGGNPNAYIVISFNPIDCVTDPCHLAWLLRDNRQLLPAITGGVCSNGIALADLSQSTFTNCP